MCFPDHLHHASVRKWLASSPEFAVCPVTEGALVRLIMRTYPNGAKLSEAVLQGLTKSKGYEFWPDSISYVSTKLGRVTGHKQVTDAYLVALADVHSSRLATFDGALAAVHPESILIPFV